MTPRSRKPDLVRYAIYARTAAGGRDQICTQVRVARAAIARHGRDGGAAIKEYLDTDTGGRSTPGAGLASLLRDAAAGLLDVVVVTDLARLSRSVARLGQIATAIEVGGARIVCVEDAG